MPSCTFQFRAFSQSTDSYDSLPREELKSRLAHLHQVPDVQNSEFENFKFKAALLFATMQQYHFMLSELFTPAKKD